MKIKRTWNVKGESFAEMLCAMIITALAGLMLLGVISGTRNIMAAAEGKNSKLNAEASQADEILAGERGSFFEENAESVNFYGMGNDRIPEYRKEIRLMNGKETGIIVFTD